MGPTIKTVDREMDIVGRLLLTLGSVGPQGEGVVTPRKGDAGLDRIAPRDALGLD